MPGIFSEIKPTALFTAFGAGCGGIIGSFFGDPVTGAQMGAGLGLKVGVANKAEKAVDKVGEKMTEGAESFGRKVEVIIDRTNEKLVATVERIGDTWATLMLFANIIDMATKSSTLSKLSMASVCKSPWDDLSCATMELRTFSINSVAIAACGALILKTVDMYRQSNLRNKV